MSGSAFTIGEFARRVGLNPKTIRYYEQIGLLPQPTRSDVGYRLYSNENIPRLRFIQRAKMLGLSLSEVRQLVDYSDGGHCDFLQEHLVALVKEKLIEVDRRVAELSALRGDLRRFLDEPPARISTTGSEPSTPSQAVYCQCIEPEATRTGSASR